MIKNATTWILVLSIVIAESHSYIPKNYAMRIENWILTVDVPMTVQWNVKNVSDEITAILYFVAMLFYNGNKVNKTTVITFIIFSVIDLVMYVHNYKTLHFGSVYVWLIGIWLLVFYRETIWKRFF